MRRKTGCRKAAAAEENTQAVCHEGANAADGVLYGLDFTFKTFGHGACNGMSEVGQQSAQVILEGVGGAFDQMEFAVASTGMPLVDN